MSQLLFVVILIFIKSFNATNITESNELVKNLIIIKNLYRVVYISHFGKIDVEDNVVIENQGPNLKGPYERTYSVQSDWFYTHLPASAENVKFYDNLGYNFNSQLYDLKKYLTLKFRLRYPLLGGWKSRYSIRYQVPIYEYLYKRTNSNYFQLKIRCLDHVLNDVVIEKVTTKIVLPVGAGRVNFTLPSGFWMAKQEFLQSFFGIRPIVIFQGGKLSENHIMDTKIIEYFYNVENLLWAQIIISIYVFCLFSIVVMYNRYI